VGAAAAAAVVAGDVEVMVEVAAAVAICSIARALKPARTLASMPRHESAGDSTVLC